MNKKHQRAGSRDKEKIVIIIMQGLSDPPMLGAQPQDLGVLLQYSPPQPKNAEGVRGRDLCGVLRHKVLPLRGLVHNNFTRLFVAGGFLSMSSRV